MTPVHDFKPLPTHCPVTGLPVHGHASWRYTSPGGGYRLRVSLIGDRIVWLQPMGHVRRDDARRGMALLEDVFYAALPGGAPFIAVDDYSAVSGASLNARRFIFNRLRQERRICTYIVYGAVRSLAAGLALGWRLGLFPYEVMIATDYAAAMAAARRKVVRLEAAAWGRGSTGEALAAVAGGGKPMASGETEAVLAAAAADLLRFVGGIVLEPYGMAPRLRTVPLDDPLRPVYDALSVLRDDRQAILERHREARQNLEARQRELTETEALLHDTHTTLDILLTNRQEERRRVEHRVREGLECLLQPLLDTLTTDRGGRTAEWIAVLRHIIDQIASPLPGEVATTAPFTAQERLIACFFTSGRNVRQIARLLGLSQRTVENHCQRMRHKLGLEGRRPTLKERLTMRTSAAPDALAGPP